MTKQISRYNRLVEDYNRLAADATFIQQNRFDRKAAFARVKNLNW